MKQSCRLCVQSSAKGRRLHSFSLCSEGQSEKEAQSLQVRPSSILLRAIMYTLIDGLQGN